MIWQNLIKAWHRSRGGFTLIEVLVAVVITGVLAVGASEAVIQLAKHTQSVTDQADSVRTMEIYTPTVIPQVPDIRVDHVYFLKTSVSPQGSGAISQNSTGPYHDGDGVSLTATPSPGWSFSGWNSSNVTIAIPTADPLSLLMPANDVNLTATFTQINYSLTVTTTGNGSVSRNATGPYHYGDSVTLTANPSPGWSFTGWSGDLSGSYNPGRITINGTKNVTANFIPDVYSMNVSVSGNGTVSQYPYGPYYYNYPVTLTAYPATGWNFSNWSGSVSGNVSPVQVTMNTNKLVIATFTQNNYSLTTAAVGNGAISQNATAPFHYGDPVFLTAVPDSGWSFSGWSSSDITIAGPTDSLLSFNMPDKPVIVTAAFSRITHSITASGGINGNIAPSGIIIANDGDNQTFSITPDANYHIADVLVDHVSQGAISSYTFPGVSADHSISVSFAINTYTVTFSLGTQATLASGSLVQQINYGGNAVAPTLNVNPGWTFTGWDKSFNNVTGTLTVNAQYTQNNYTLTVTATNGTVAKSPNQPTYHYGDAVTLPASPNTGWSFNNWSGDLTGSTNPGQITINGGKNIAANFSINTYTVTFSLGTQATLASGSLVQQINYGGNAVAPTLNVNPGWTFTGWDKSFNNVTGTLTVNAQYTQNNYTLTVTATNGTVAKSPNQSTYHYSDAVTLTASPNTGWSFNNWSGDLTGSTNPGQITINGGKNIAANFTQNSYSLTVSTSGGGTVTPSPSGPSYHYGDIVTLSAAPNTGWTFNGWTGDLTGSTNPGQITVNGNKNVTASFTQNTYSLTVNVSGTGTVSQSPGGPYHYGDTVTLTPTPGTGWSFSNWSGDLTGNTNPGYLTVNNNKTVTAVFTSSASFYNYALIALNGDISITSNSLVSSDPSQVSGKYEGDIYASGAVKLQPGNVKGDATANNNSTLSGGSHIYGNFIADGGSDTLSLSGGSTIDGNANAKTINLSGGSTVGSQSHNPTTPLTFNLINIDSYKTQADAGAVTAAQYNTYLAAANAGGTGAVTIPNYGTYTLTSKHVTGDLTMSGSVQVTMTGTVWVDGKVTISGSAALSGSGVLIAAGGDINVSNSGSILSTGSGLLVIAKTGSISDTGNSPISNCQIYAANSLTVSGSSSAVSLPAQHLSGSINISGSSQVTLSGTVYVDGTITVSGSSQLNGPAFSYQVIAAEGNIAINGSQTAHLDASVIPLIISKGNITASGTGGWTSGILYAPSGTITFNGGNSFYGSAIGQSINLSSGSVTYPTALRSRN